LFGHFRDHRHHRHRLLQEVKKKMNQYHALKKYY